MIIPSLPMTVDNTTLYSGGQKFVPPPIWKSNFGVTFEIWNIFGQYFYWTLSR
jgi:hypothetical protein